MPICGTVRYDQRGVRCAGWPESGARDRNPLRPLTGICALMYRWMKPPGAAETMAALAAPAPGPQDVCCAGLISCRHVSDRT